jgi:4-amino-4-deoxy-L-arabinose transferase-like glycosyltransferase
MTALGGARVRAAAASQPPARDRWTEPVVVVGALAVFAWGTLRLVGVDAPLGHDEAWYAAMGEALLQRGDYVGLASHRPAFFGWLSAPIQLLSQGETALRLLTLPFGLALLLAAWWLARHMGRAAGLVALAGLAATPTLYRGAASFLTDLPAAALLLIAVALLWYGFEERAAPGWTVAAAAVCMAGAFHLRFGSILPVALVLVAALAVWRDQLRTNARALAGGALVGVTLLLPHAIASTMQLGAPWRRVVETSASVTRELDDPGLLTYLDMFPDAWPGLLPAVLTLAAVGVLMLALLAPRSLDSRLRRLVLLLAGPALLHFLLIGWTAHADVRFLFPALAFGVTAGAAVTGLAWSRLAVRTGWRGGLTVALAAVLLAGAAHGAAGYRDELARRARTGEDNRVVQRAALEIARTEDPPHCLVLTAYNPQVQWYSGCPAVKLPVDAEGVHEHTSASDVLLVLFEGGKHQPEGAALDVYLERAGARGRAAVIDTGTASPLEPVTIHRVPQQTARD